MIFYSDRNKNLSAGFREAVINGLAEDGGLFVPEIIPHLPTELFSNLNNMDIKEIAFKVLSEYTGDEIPESNLRDIIQETFTFPIPLIEINDEISVLEITHGPTLAFKDIGARFLANTMSYFVRGKGKQVNILVATSGDTGSAVANGFYGIEGINVFLLYPSGKVSRLQEMQLTTLDKNITAFEVEGTFDDCQALVKKAFTDKSLYERITLSSANSINIARLLPQSIYYFEGFKQLKNKDKSVFCVPSGNLGNLTAGLIAKRMGLPIDKFIAATNSNKVFTDYLSTGNFEPKPSVKTLSNAMDVGNPSNISRINFIYKGLLDSMRGDIHSYSFSDLETIEALREVRDNYGYIIDPHGAVGYLGVKEFFKEKGTRHAVILETAHPSKFTEIIEEALGEKPDMPERLGNCLKKEKKSLKISNKYDEFKEFLLKLAV